LPGETSTTWSTPCGATARMSAASVSEG
jgi:hypothetical protein